MDGSRRRTGLRRSRPVPPRRLRSRRRRGGSGAEDRAFRGRGSLALPPGGRADRSGSSGQARALRGGPASRSARTCPARSGEGRAPEHPAGGRETIASRFRPTPESGRSAPAHPLRRPDSRLVGPEETRGPRPDGSPRRGGDRGERPCGLGPLLGGRRDLRRPPRSPGRREPARTNRFPVGGRPSSLPSAGSRRLAGARAGRPGRGRARRGGKDAPDSRSGEDRRSGIDRGRRLRLRWDGGGGPLRRARGGMLLQRGKAPRRDAPLRIGGALRRPLGRPGAPALPADPGLPRRARASRRPRVPRYPSASARGGPRFFPPRPFRRGLTPIRRPLHSFAPRRRGHAGRGKFPCRLP